MRTFIVVGLLTLIGTLALGVREARASDVVPANTWCPVMPERRAKAEFTLEHNGVEVALCCRMCKVKFAKDPETYLGVLADMKSRPESPRVAVESIHEEALSTESEEPPAALDPLTKAGRFHPVIVHFPIALLIAAALAEMLLALGFLKRAGEDIARFCWWGGTATALAAGALGWLAAMELTNPPDHLDTHRYLGMAATALALMGAWLEWRARNREVGSATFIWRCWLGITICTIGATGHFGGVLVYGPDFLSF